MIVSRMKLKCPNCKRLVPLYHNTTVRFIRCDTCNKFCCEYCKDNHVKEIHGRFTVLSEDESKKFIVDEN